LSGCVNGSSFFVKVCVTGLAESNSIFTVSGGKWRRIEWADHGQKAETPDRHLTTFNQIVQQITNVRVVK
jgi:hypothetical protein